MLVKIEDIEIRGCETKESKKDGKKYIIVRFEDTTGKAHEILDRDMENEPFYRRGTVGAIYADLEIRQKYTKFEVRRFEAAAKS